MSGGFSLSRSSLSIVEFVPTSYSAIGFDQQTKGRHDLRPMLSLLRFPLWLEPDLSLHRAYSKAGDEAVKEQVIDKGNRQAGNQAGRHERSPEINVATHQEDGNAYADHLLRLWGNERQGINVFLGHQGKGEDHYRQDA